MISHLECSRDATHRCSPHALATVCPDDGAPLLVRYAGAALRREAVDRAAVDDVALPRDVTDCRR